MPEEMSANSTRCIVSGREPGGILPGVRSEMWRDLYLRPGADIEGGVFCNRLHVEGGPVRVRGAVYAREAIEITCRPGEDAEGATVEFGSVVTTPDSIMVDEKCGTRVRFLADVMAGRVRLRNSWVRGNVAARNGIIGESVVLGAVLCDGTLSLRDVIVGSFKAASVNLQPEIALLDPFASTSERPRIGTRVRCLGLAGLRALLAGEDTVSGIVDLTDEDFVQVVESMREGARQVWMLTLAPRILDLEKVQDRIRENRRILEALSLGDHLEPHARAEFDGGILRTAEDALFRALRGLPDALESGWTSIEEVRERQTIKSFVDAEAGPTP